jgi:2-polyprenyl-3-methyl-5-hydroxy-6-metoxy-1,4-benzoquinol methylase
MHCPICHSDVGVKYKLAFNVYQCKKCYFQFAPDACFDKSLVSDLDESIRIKALKNLRMLNFNRIVISLKKHVDSNSNGLDVGSGHGWFLEVCKENGINCLGIEPETHFNELYKSMGVEVLNGFFPDIVPSDAKYNFIAYNDVFEHLPDIKAAMKINNDLLNSKGKLIVNLPLRGGVTYIFSRLAYRFGVKSLINRMWQFNFHSPHLSYFSRKNLIKLAESADFRLIEFFPLKTINLSEIKDRVNEDKNLNLVFRCISIIGVFALYPFLQFLPDTYCFIFQKKDKK